MYRKNIRLLSYFNFFLGFSLFAPLAIIYYSQVSGSYFLGASIFGLAMLASAVFEVPTGVLSDRVGRKGTVILGSWARVFSFVCYAVGLSYGWLVAGAILEGLSRAFYSGNNNALLHDSLADEGLSERYDEYLGKSSSTEQLALAISALLGGFIANYSYTYLLWLAVICQLPLLYISYQFHEPRLRSRLDINIYSHFREALTLFVRNKKLRLLSLASILNFSTGELNFQFRAAFFALVWPVWAIGFSNILSNVGATLSFYYSGQILRRIKAVNFLFFKTIYGKSAYLLALIFPSALSPLLMSSTSFLFGAGEVAESALMQKEFTDHQRATMSSLNSLFGSIGFALMSLFLGSLADSIGPGRAMIVVMLFSLPTIFIYWLLFRRERGDI